MLTPKSCDLFNIPFFQFSQLKKYQPESIPQIKADYKENWQVWQQLIQQVAAELGAPFAPPHIERWCNGWQVRAHFFAYFKYEQYKNSAAILSILLNRRRLSVSLDWHCYKADVSPIALPDYNRWLDNFDTEKYASFDMWHGAESEYDDYRTASQPNIFGVAKMKLFDGKTDFLQAFGQQLLAVLVIRRNGRSGNQLLGKL